VLALFKERGFSIDLQGIDKLIAAAAMGDTAGANAIAAAAMGDKDRANAIAAAAMGDTAGAASLAANEQVPGTVAAQDPGLKEKLLAMGGALLARFTLSNNQPGVKILLELGIDVNTPYIEGDGYWGIPPNSLPIHIAAWLLHTDMVRFLLERGAVVDQPDANGNTPLMLAVKACTDSYWKGRCSTELLQTLEKYR
jgi:hypothetical protein